MNTDNKNNNQAMNNNDNDNNNSQAMDNNNNTNNNPKTVSFTFVEGYTSTPRGRGAEAVEQSQQENTEEQQPSSNNASQNQQEEALINSIDDENESPVVTHAFDEASTWLVIELTEEYFERLELSSSTAHRAALYREMLDQYNSNPNTNGRRTLRAILGKWNELVKVYRRRRDQQNRAGTSPQAPWTFHEKMAELGEKMATITPPTVYTSFMRFGSTVDNRANMTGARSNRSGSRNGQRIDPSIQQFTEAMRELSDYNYARAAPEREALLNHLQSSNTFMQQFLQSRERTNEHLRVRNELMERRTIAMERAMNAALDRILLPPSSLPQAPSVNEQSPSSTAAPPSSSSNPNKRRRLSL